MLRARVLLLLLLALLFHSPVSSDVVCDGIDDILTSWAATDALITTSTGTVFLTLKHTGSISSGGLCGRDQLWTMVGAESVGLLVNVNPGWAAKNFSGGTTQCATTPAFSTAWTTLTWRRADGFLDLFVNGALVASAASAATSATVSPLATLCWNGTQVDGAAPITVAQVAWYATSVSENQIAAYGNSFVRQLLPSGATSVVEFNFCTPGVSTHTYVFPDRTGNGRHIDAAQGANASGVTCAGATGMVVMGGIQ